MWPIVWKVLLLAMIGVRSHKCAAAMETVSANLGGHCSFRGITGKWTPLIDCSTASSMVTVTDYLRNYFGYKSILVCCNPDDVLSRRNFESCEIIGKLEYIVNSGDPHEIIEKCTKPAPLNGPSVAKCISYRRIQDGDCSNESPFLVELFDSRQLSIELFSGILVSDKFVLTTAVCLTKYEPKFVKVGTQRPCNFVEVQRGLVHPDYNHLNHYNHNIGLIELKLPVTLSTFVRPACLPVYKEFDTDNVRTMASIQLFSNNTIDADVSVVGWLNCKSLYEKYLFEYDDDRHFCGTRTSSTPCNVKDGGAIYSPDSHNSCSSTVYGIQSNQDGCLSIMFIRLFHYVKWIERVAF